MQQTVASLSYVIKLQIFNTDFLCYETCGSLLACANVLKIRFQFEVSLQKEIFCIEEILVRGVKEMLGCRNVD